MKHFLKNWKTTFFGVTSILTGVKLLITGQTVEGISIILSGFGLAHAKDQDNNF